jgi:DNA helicase-2/ATP-dependent DNA helicase PcrA
MEEALRRRGIPYKIYRGTSFYQRKEVKDLLAYFRLTVNPRDDEAFERIVNYPARGLGEVTVGRIAAVAAERNLSMFEAAATVPHAETGIKGATAAKLAEFVELIRSLSLARADYELYPFGMEVASRSGILTLFKTDRSPEARSALDNIEELLGSIQSFAEQELYEESYDDITGELIVGQPISPTVEEWLQSIALLTDQDNQTDEERDRVTLMTVHAAKGLEFRFVFIVGLEERLFPSEMSIGQPEGLEEERRLFYVALTRAKEAAILSFAQNRFKWGRTEFCSPSRFLGEIERQYVEADFDLAELGGGEQRPAEAPQPSAHKPFQQKPFDRKPFQKPAAQQKPEPAKPAVFGEGSKYRLMENRIVFAATAAPPAPSSGATESYEVGMAVAHAKFGRGAVVEIEQMASDRKITVDFDSVGRKVLLAKFAKLTKA